MTKNKKWPVFLYQNVFLQVQNICTGICCCFVKLVNRFNQTANFRPWDFAQINRHRRTGCCGIIEEVCWSNVQERLPSDWWRGPRSTHLFLLATRRLWISWQLATEPCQAAQETANYRCWSVTYRYLRHQHYCYICALIVSLSSLRCGLNDKHYCCDHGSMQMSVEYLWVQLSEQESVADGWCPKTAWRWCRCSVLGLKVVL